MAEPALPAEQPLVTAIVSTYEGARFLAGCLDDLEAQSIADRLEIVVVDSGSPQDEQAIAARYQQRFGNISYVRTDRRETIYGAWNRALALARGRYVTNANVDDRHRADGYAVLADALESNPGVALVYADVAVTETPNVGFEDAPLVGHFRWPEFDRATLEACPCVGPMPMWRRALHDRFGLFDAELEVAGDYDWWLRLAATERFLHVPEAVGLYLYRAGSLEHADEERTRIETADVRRRHGIERQDSTTPSFFFPVGDLSSRIIGGLEENREWLVRQVSDWRAEAERLNAECESLRAESASLRAESASLRAESARLLARIDALETALEQLLATRTFRYSAPAREIYSRVRRSPSVPADVDAAEGSASGRSPGADAAAPVAGSEWVEFVPPGHFYSAIPDISNLPAQLEAPLPSGPEKTGIDLRDRQQIALMEQFADRPIPFTEERVPGLRYHFGNEMFGHGDGTFLYLVLEHFRPNRIIEVGSGFSSACILDALEIAEIPAKCLFISPFPDRQTMGASESDLKEHEILASRVQDVDLSVFARLTANDLLFIDTSHAAKFGSDVNHIFFNVLPCLAPGVIVHFHDVFPAFEYPGSWLAEGRFWSEAYLLRAFLQYNSTYRILLWPPYVSATRPDLFARFPTALPNPGGSIYLQRA